MENLETYYLILETLSTLSMVAIAYGITIFTIKSNLDDTTLFKKSSKNNKKSKKTAEINMDSFLTSTTPVENAVVGEQNLVSEELKTKASSLELAAKLKKIKKG